jgi:hypothetical protein
LLWHTKRFKTPRDKVTSSHLLPSPKSLSRPISKTQDPNGMVKMLPIPSLKKVRITKTKISNKEIAPRQSVPEEISSKSRRHDAPLQKKSWSSSHCYVTFALKTQKGDRRSLGFVLVLPVPTGQEEKRALQCQKVPGKELSQSVLSDISFNWFCLLCYLLSCCVAFFNRECLGETRSVSKRDFSQGKRG